MQPPRLMSQSKATALASKEMEQDKKCFVLKNTHFVDIASLTNPHQENIRC